MPSLRRASSARSSLITATPGDSRRIHVRLAQVDDELDSTKSEDSERIISLDKNRTETLKAWRKAQTAERHLACLAKCLLKSGGSGI